MTTAPTPISWAVISKTNYDLEERLGRLGVRLDYDEDGDTLFITIGEGGPSFSKEAIDHLYVRIDPTTYKIVGCTIIRFATDFLAKNKVLRKMFPDALDQLRAAGGVVEWKGHQAERTRPLFEVAMARQ